MSVVTTTSKESSSEDPRRTSVVVTGWGIHVPNVDLADLVPETDYGPACPPDRAYELLGRKGLLYKEPATRLALCAVHRALGREPGARRPEGPPDAGTAVVVSSNFGNIATVHKVAGILREATVRDVSSLDAPNASSNVIASTIAIWYRFGGPNLMVCSGATSGLDALVLACTLVRANRAERVLVIGVEPDDEVATRLYQQNQARLGSGGALRAGAACVILERLTQVTAELPVLGRSYRMAGIDDITGLPRSALVFGPAAIAPAGARIIDLASRIGDLFGALGVLQLAVSVAMRELVPDPPSDGVLICGNRVEGWRSLEVTQSGLPMQTATPTMLNSSCRTS